MVPVFVLDGCRAFYPDTWDTDSMVLGVKSHFLGRQFPHSGILFFTFQRELSVLSLLPGYTTECLHISVALSCSSLSFLRQTSL